MKKFLLLSLFVLFAITFTGCMKDPEPVDTFNKSEWEKDVTEKVSEIKFTNGTWKFRKYVSYEIHSQFDEYYYGEFVITNNAQDIEKDLKPYLEFVSGICGERIEKLDSSDIKIVSKSDEAYISFRPKTNTGIKIGEVRFGFSGWQINSRNFKPSMKIIAYCGDAVIKI